MMAMERGCALNTKRIVCMARLPMYSVTARASFRPWPRFFRPPPPKAVPGLAAHLYGACVTVTVSRTASSFRSLTMNMTAVPSPRAASTPSGVM